MTYQESESESVPATAMQVGLLVENELEEVRSINVVQIIGDINEPFKPDSFSYAWNQVLKEFDVLRMGLYRSSRGDVRAEFASRATIDCKFNDCINMSANEAESHFAKICGDRQKAGIDVDCVPPMRVDCFLLTKSRWRFLWTYHHSLLEGYSVFLVISRLFDVYDAHCNEEARVEELQPRFRDFLEWSGLQSHEDGLACFRDLLVDFQRPTPLPFTQRRQNQKDLAAGLTSAQLSVPQTSKLESAARLLGVTPNTIVQLCWGLLLSRYTGETDIVFGATWSSRGPEYSKSKKLAGLLMNTTPVRVRFNPGQTVRDALVQLRAQHHRTKPFRHTPLSSIRAETDVPSNQPLFQSVVVFDYQRFSERLESIGGVWANRSFRTIQMTGNPVTVEVFFLEGQLSVEIEYRAGLFTSEQANRLIQNYVRLLINAVDNLDCPLGKVRMLSNTTFRELISDQVQRERPTNPPGIVESILLRVEENPDKIAIESPIGTPTSYDELEFASRAVAERLLAEGAKPECIAAIMAPRSSEAIVAMLGALRAGVAFVPIDPLYPEERIRFFLKDSAAQYILATKSIDRKISHTAPHVILLDSLSANPNSGGFVSAPPNSLAYVMYTSGSTGSPKGVCISRAAMANHCKAVVQLFELGPNDRVLQLLSHSFDASLEEIFPTFCAGATLVLRHDESTVGADKFFDEIERRQISVLNLPTAFWHYLVNHKGSNNWPRSSRLLVIGGEKAHGSTYEKFKTQNTSHVRLLNSYGPTEATITSTVFDDRTVDSESILPIGKPIESVSHFVLDSLMRPVPCGEVGQLFIGGQGLANGYLGRPDLTSESFIPHPFNKGSRLYATGDLVFLTEARNFEYVGRADNQVKIRGYRIEPGEIEAHLISIPQVTEAAVIPDTSDPQAARLVAHVAIGTSSVTEKKIRDSLSELVPAHLVPAEIQIHPSLPKSTSGKIDRKRLATLDGRGNRRPEKGSLRDSGIPGFFESEVREIWGNLLNQSNPEFDSDFFDAGGDSLRLIEFFSEIEHRTRQKPNPVEFLRRPTFGHIVQLLEKALFSDATQLIVRLNQGASELRPLFLAPGVKGSAVDYVHLANSLNPAIPLIGLQIDQISDHAESALHDFASRCADDMQRIQKNGPYAVAGFSAGGVIALAIAQIMLSRGQQVDFVGVIDSAPPSSVERPWPFSSPQHSLRFVRAVLNRAMARSGDSTQGLSWLFQRLRPSIIWRYVTWTENEGEEDEIAELLDLAEGQVADHLKAKWQRILNAVNAYQHSKLAADITLFRTAFDPVEGPHEPDLGWGRVGSKEIFVEHLPGTHSDVLTSKSAPAIAMQMESYLLGRTTS